MVLDPSHLGEVRDRCVRRLEKGSKSARTVGPVNITLGAVVPPYSSVRCVLEVWGQ